MEQRRLSTGLTAWADSSVQPVWHQDSGRKISHAEKLVHLASHMRECEQIVSKIQTKILFQLQKQGTGTCISTAVLENPALCYPRIPFSSVQSKDDAHLSAWSYSRPSPPGQADATSHSCKGSSSSHFSSWSCFAFELSRKSSGQLLT